MISVPRMRYSATLAALAVLTACASTGPDSSDTDVRVAAIVNGQAITIDELDTWIKQDLFRREMGADTKAKRYEMRSAAIRRMVDELLLEHEAQRHGLDPAAMMQTRLKERGPIEDQEVEDFYQKNMQNIEGGGELEELRPRIRGHLESQRRGEVFAELRSTASVSVLLDPPRSTVPGSGPSRGPADAPVVIVEFSDYQCPFCRRAERTLNKILERYPNEVRWEYRHFPLSNHPRAQPAAEAAVCAEAQGMFWPYHEKLFAHQTKLDAKSLGRYAVEVGLDMAEFESCRKSPEPRGRVEDDQRAGTLAGAGGTPSFFINGIFLNGARPFAQFEELIEIELERIASSDN